VRIYENSRAFLYLSTSTTISSGRKRRPWLLFGFFFSSSASGILFSLSRFDMDGVGVSGRTGQVHCTHATPGPGSSFFLKRRHPPSDDRIERGYRITSECDGLQNEQRRWSGFEV
jgi:hypothetical protein